jgi:acyl carrier protein
MPLTDDTLISLLCEVTGMEENEVTGQTTLVDIEMDSLLLAEFATVLAERHGVDLPNSLHVTPTTTIADLVHALAEQSSSAAAAPSGMGAR